MKFSNYALCIKTYGLTGVAIAGMALSSTTSAELMGVDTARSANVSDYSQYSIEGAVKVGEADLFGGRLTANLGNGLAVYGNLGLLDFDDADSDDELAYGIGAIYELEGLLEGLDTAITTSFHRADFDGSFNTDITLSSLAVRGLVSGPLEADFNYPLTWYASVGFERVHFEVETCANGLGNQICRDADDSDIELAFGGGVIATIESGEVYLGTDYVDGLTLTAGYRHSF